MWSERWVNNLQAHCQRDPGAPGTGHLAGAEPLASFNQAAIQKGGISQDTNAGTRTTRWHSATLFCHTLTLPATPEQASSLP